MNIQPNANPLVTVIIPNYNHERYLSARIESVLNQTVADIEVIILDDCSPDNSRMIIDKYAALDNRIRVVYNEQNSGSTFKQWNKGIKLAKGKYTWIAESDDLAEPDFLKILISRLQTDDAIVLAYSDSFDIDESSTVKGTITWYLTHLDPMWSEDFVTDGVPLIRKYMSYRNIIPNASAVLLRTDVLRAIGPVDENYRLFGDIVFWARVISKGKVAYVARPLNYFRTHQNNARTKTRIDGTSLEENSRVLGIMRAYGQPDPDYRKKALQELLDLWYNTWIHHGVTWERHKAIFNNVAAVEPALVSKMVSTVGRNFFYKANGFRVLFGDKFLYKLIRKNRSS